MNNLIEKFEEILCNELDQHWCEKSNPIQIKKKLVEEFKKKNPELYQEKQDLFFDELHPY